MTNLDNACGSIDEEVRILKSAIEQMTEMMIITHADLENFDPEIIYVNPAFLEVTGYEAEEVIGKTPKILQGPETNRELLKKLKKLLLDGDTFHGSTINYKKDGTPYHVEWNIAPVKNEEGEIKYWVSVQQDITKRKLAEKELERYTQKLEEEVKKKTREVIQVEKMAALGTLVAGISHEINNPASYIMANLEFLQEDIEELADEIEESKYKELNELIQINLEGVNRITKINNTLKRFSRPGETEKVLSDINQGLKDTILLMHNELKNKIKLHEEYGNIPKIRCYSNELNQVFLNLIKNAAESMDGGDLWVKTSQDDDNIIIEIIDNGKGMTEAEIDNVFDPFYTTKDDGTGLGMSVSYNIIKKHDGNIRYDSELDEGTKVTIKIPKER